jgi:hypothetical protein
MVRIAATNNNYLVCAGFRKLHCQFRLATDCVRAFSYAISAYIFLNT